MPHINNKEAPEPTDKMDYDAVPEGTYHVKVDEIYERSTSKGDCMWGLRLKIVDGPHEGASIFDNMVFSDNKRAKSRVKLITSRLGIPKDYIGELTMAMLLDKECKVVTTVDFYQGKKKNVIPFDGYIRIDDEPAKETAAAPAKLEDSDDIPF
jgi:hypothetical protein